MQSFIKFQMFILFTFLIGLASCNSDNLPDSTTTDEEKLIIRHDGQDMIFTQALNLAELLKSIDLQTNNSITGVGGLVNEKVLSVEVTTWHKDSAKGTYNLADSENKVKITAIKSYDLPNMISTIGTLKITAYDTYYAGEFEGTFEAEDDASKTFELSGEFKIEL